LELYERPENEFVAQFIGSPAMNLLSGKVVATGEMTKIELDGGGFAVSAIPTRDEDMGIAVNIGIRPEDFVASTPDDAIFQGTVNITEALGEVTLLYFEPVDGAEPVIGKLQGIHKDLRGNSVALTCDPAKVHIFHKTQSLLYRDRPIKIIETNAH
jgi:alpha-glucoside transport system ATP-binding protein